MNLAHELSELFPDTEQQLGSELFDNACVTDVERTGDVILGSVCTRGGNRAVVINLADLKRGRVRVSCNCGSSRMPCAHLWAVILDYDLQAAGTTNDHRGLISRSPSASRKGRSGSKAWHEQIQAIDAQVAKSDSLFHGATDPSDPTDRYTRRRLAYWLIEASKSVGSGKLTIGFRQRESRKTNTEWGKVKLANLWNLRATDFSDPADAKIVGMLRRWEGFDANHRTDYSSWGYYAASYSPRTVNELSISSELCDTILPLMAKTGRLYWLMSADLPFEDANPLVLEERAYRLQLRIVPNEEKKCWHVDGQLLDDSNDVARPLTDVVLSINDTWVVLKERLIRVSQGDGVWISNLCRLGGIRIPFGDRENLLRMLAESRRLPELLLPEDLQWRQETSPPAPRLHILQDETTHDTVHAQIWFSYGENRGRHRRDPVSWYDGEANLRVARDGRAEDALVAAASHLLPAHDGLSRSVDSDVRFPPDQLSTIVGQLNDLGWVVEAHGKPVRRAGAISIAVHSGIDWFDLDARVDFGGTSVQLPQLLKAIADGRNTIVLDDGTLGLVAEDWLKKYIGWGQLSETEEGMLRFKSSQALLLDALLASEKSVATDQQFDDLRRRMAEFRGIREAQPDAAFRGELRVYQQEGLGWLKFLEEFGLGGCLADDMGLGKTVQVLAHLVSRRQAGDNAKPSLVVVPKSLVFNWMREAERFAPSLRMANYTGLERSALRDRFPEFDVVVTTYGTMRRDILDLKNQPFDYVILDESQAVKNAHSLSAKASRLLNADHRLAMTGTPVENHLGEIWSLFEFLNPGLLGRSGVFERAVRNPAPHDETVEFLSKALSPYILRRTKQQVLTELPEKSEQTVYCDLAPKERRYYDELRDYYRAMLDKNIDSKGLGKSKIQVLEALLRLRQAACHPGLIDKNRVGESSTKIQVLLEQLAEVTEEGHKALVFSQFTSLLAIVRKQLDDQNIAYEYLDGRTRDRQEKVDRFQNDPSRKLFLISLKAGGVGLNLTAADYVFILDPWWNPAVETQAIDRTHRIGQSKRVFAYRLIARDTVEEKVVQLQQSKRDLADAIIRADNSLLRTLTTDDLRMLLG